MNVRAKFRVTSVQQYPTAGEFQYAQVTMMPVYNDSPENESWSKATPSGQISMMITNPEAAGAFVTGKSYLVDFTPVD